MRGVWLGFGWVFFFFFFFIALVVGLGLEKNLIPPFIFNPPAFSLLLSPFNVLMLLWLFFFFSFPFPLLFYHNSPGLPTLHKYPPSLRTYLVYSLGTLVCLFFSFIFSFLFFLVPSLLTRGKRERKKTFFFFYKEFVSLKQPRMTTEFMGRFILTPACWIDLL